MYERIYCILILRDLIHEVKLTALKDTKIWGLHQTSLPILTPNRAISPTFGPPEVFGTQWFRRIVVLIFGMALIPTIYHIYFFCYFYLHDQRLLHRFFAAIYHLCLLVSLHISDSYLRMPFVFILESAN